MNHSPACWPEGPGPLFSTCRVGVIQGRCVGFASAHCCTTTLLTHRKGKICSPLESGLCSCCWWRHTTQLCENCCPKAFPCSRAASGRPLFAPPTREQLQVQQLEHLHVLWAVLAWGRKTKAKLHISQLHFSYVLEHRVQTLCLWPCLSSIQPLLTSVKVEPRFQRRDFVSSHAKCPVSRYLVC